MLTHIAYLKTITNVSPQQRPMFILLQSSFNLFPFMGEKMNMFHKLAFKSGLYPEEMEPKK